MVRAAAPPARAVGSGEGAAELFQERKLSLWPATSTELANAGYRDAEQSTACRGPICRVTIFWWLTPNNQRIPLALDDGAAEGEARYVPHFANCPDRAEYSRKNRNGGTISNAKS